MESYTGLSQIYDKTIDMDYQKWSSFVLEYFKQKDVQTRGKKLLELGCGTGNMTMKLREIGFDITGLDLSADMLEAAMEKALKKRYKIMFINQNMIDFKMNRKYDFVFSFCDGYNYLLSERELKNSFTRVYEHLNGDGYFLFDISTEHKLKNLIGNQTFTRNEDEISYIWDNYLEKDLLEMYITFFISEGKLYRRVKEKHVQRAWKNEELVKLLEHIGFTEIELFDDYSFNEARSNSLRTVFICKKEEK